MKRWHVEIYGFSGVFDAETRSKARYAAFRQYRDAVNSCLCFHQMMYNHHIYRIQ